jgi:hypothetical protein
VPQTPAPAPAPTPAPAPAATYPFSAVPPGSPSWPSKTRSTRPAWAANASSCGGKGAPSAYPPWRQVHGWWQSSWLGLHSLKNSGKGAPSAYPPWQGGGEECMCKTMAEMGGGGGGKKIGKEEGKRAKVGWENLRGPI